MTLGTKTSIRINKNRSGFPDSDTDAHVEAVAVVRSDGMLIPDPSLYIPDTHLAMAAGGAVLWSDLWGTVNKFGNGQITAGNTFEIWDGDMAYSWPVTALITHMSQTTDQATMRGETIEIHGLDANYAIVQQTAILDATLTTNTVELTIPMIRCFRVKALTGVVATSPIRMHNIGETIDYAIISVPNQQTGMAIYTVPAGKSAYMTQYWAHHNPATGQDPTSNAINLWSQDNANGYAPQFKHSVGLPNGDGFVHPFKPYQKFTEKEDIYMTASPVGKDANVSAGFDLIIINN
jgi:hypothetical protein